MTAQNKNAALDGTNIQSGGQKSEDEESPFFCLHDTRKRRV